MKPGSMDKPTEAWESLVRRQELKDKYHNLDNGAKGSIKQKLSNAIIEEIKDLVTTKEVWKHLEDKFNKAGSAQVFRDIQKVYAFQIEGNQNPETEISKLALLFAHLKAQGAELSNFYQAMTLLNAGSMKWPHLVSIYLAQNEMKELNFNEIKVMFVADWHRTATLGQPTPKVNKVSGVQQKRKDPNWKKGKGKDNTKSDSTRPTSPSSEPKSSSGRKFQGEFSPQEELIAPDPTTVPDPEVVIDWDDVVSLGDEPQETYTEAEIVKNLTTLIDESMDYLFEEMIQDA
ncbi:hypothetical protein AMATHDRAFT_10351 [Amanita thiersii Skay4041]|uniref:Uncharacterized protein n=1 Tax=Amanita thiersii Skay4041 TaxID=703135 RepID=A0A2A9NB01_9AGAR|nr:hypothetical protein AMATHDRAFT_10351 [Amanita thiersii Skay4041]